MGGDDAPRERQCGREGTVLLASRLSSGLTSIARLAKGDAGRWMGLALFFAVAAVIQTWPLVRHANDSITVWWFFPYDAWQFLWNIWWVKHALVTLHTDPFHTDLLLFPQGSDLYLHPLTFVNGVLSIPLQLATKNLILTWNVLALLFFVLAGLGAYALSYRVTRNHFAALLSGYIFAFAPFTLMRLGGHWNIFATWPIPLFILFLLRFQDSGRLREAVGVGISWAILTLNWLEFGTDAALFLAIFLAYWSFVYVRDGERVRLASLWRGAVVIGAVWFAVSSPLLVPALQNIRSGEFFQPGGDESFSADLLAYVTVSPLWGPGEAPLIGGPNPEHLPVGSVEDTAYLGIMPLLLAGLAIFAGRKAPHRAVFWLVVFLVFAVLALGPYLYVDDTKTLSILGVSFTVPLPYQIYDQLPLLGERRVPARMIVFGMIALSVLSGIGLNALTTWLKPRHMMVAPLLAVAVLGVVVLEYWNPPVFLTELSTPDIFDEIRDEPGDFTVLHAPLGRRSGWTYTGDPTGGPITNYYQTLHGKASFGGYLSRVSDRGFAWIHDQPGIRYLACPGCPGPPSEEDLDGDLVRQVFKKYEIKYVVLHRLGPDGQGLYFIGEKEIETMDAYLRDVVGLTPIYDNPSLTVYRNEEVG